MLSIKKYREEEALNVNLTPLLDVVFLLLIFFMVSTTFDKPSRLGIELPEAVGQKMKADVDRVIVSINSKNEIFVNENKLTNHDRRTLVAALAQLGEASSSKGFELMADHNTSHGSVAMVMDVAGELGYRNIDIQTKSPSQ